MANGDNELVELELALVSSTCSAYQPTETIDEGAIASESLSSVVEWTLNEKRCTSHVSSISFAHDVDGAYELLKYGSNDERRMQHCSDRDLVCIDDSGAMHNLSTVSEIIREAIERAINNYLEQQTQDTIDELDSLDVCFPSIKNEDKDTRTSTPPDWTFTATTDDGFSYRFDKYGHDIGIQFGPSPGHLAQDVQLTADKQTLVTLERPFLGWSQMVHFVRKEPKQEVHIEHYDTPNRTVTDEEAPSSSVSVKQTTKINDSATIKNELAIELDYVDDDGFVRTVRLSIGIEVNEKK